MKKKLTTLGLMLMLAVGSSLTLASCGGDKAEEGTEAEGKKCEEGKCEEGKCEEGKKCEGDKKCEEGKCEAGKDSTAS